MEVSVCSLTFALAWLLPVAEVVWDDDRMSPELVKDRLSTLISLDVVDQHILSLALEFE